MDLERVVKLGYLWKDAVHRTRRSKMEEPSVWKFRAYREWAERHEELVAAEWNALAAYEVELRNIQRNGFRFF